MSDIHNASCSVTEVVNREVGAKQRFLTVIGCCLEESSRLGQVPLLRGLTSKPAAGDLCGPN